MITLFESGGHKNVMFNDLSVGSMVQANQHIIISGKEAIILDPGGHKVYSRLFSDLSALFPINGVKHVFFSHQDPDIIAAANGWLMVTEATAHLSGLWMRFITHFGVDEMVTKRIKAIPDQGTTLSINNETFKVIPAHFLHSSGNFQVYDPVAKILYTGDLGASVGNDAAEVSDFESHIQYMETFHKRYMPSTKALKLWAKMARELEIDIIAPQHGAVFKGGEMVKKFIDWIDSLEVGVGLIEDTYAVPS